MIPLAALPLLSMGCFGDALRSVCGRSAKIVDRSVVSYGAELLSQAVPRALDAFVEASTRKKRVAVLEALSLALDEYRHGYTLSLVARWLRGVESLASARETCREAGYTVASRSRELGRGVAEALLSLLDHDLLITSLLPRLGIWGFSRRVASARDEVAELSRSVSLLVAAVAIAADAWGRRGKVFDRVSRFFEEELSETIERVDSSLDAIAILVDPENEDVARELVRGGER